jgi:GDP-4-dehydro-6-deoxy-D-mannose reductase
MAEHYLKNDVSPRIIVVSSGALYDPNQPMPLTEDSKLSYNSPYAVSKALVENQCTYYQKRGLDCIVVRPFNHIGPGQTEGFLIPDVIAQLKASDTVTVGNISTRRDFTDVRDIVRAYRLLVEAVDLKHSVYNACSGVSTSGEEVVNSLKTICQKPNAKIVVDQSKVRPTDAPEIYGDSSALQADTGWNPEIELRQTLIDCVEAAK